MLRKSKGNMYEFITHTWNPIKGRCLHNCLYCYMKRIYPNATQPRLAKNELYIDFGKGNKIFIGSSTDLFAVNIPSEWIFKILDFCQQSNVPEMPNTFLLQSKNPKRFLEFINHSLMAHVEFCTTLETNRYYPDIMNNAPRIEERVEAMAKIAELGFKTMVTAEPLMDFDLGEFVELIRRCKPYQVNIGRNSIRDIILPEPDPKKVHDLVTSLRAFTRVEIKKNASIWFE